MIRVLQVIGIMNRGGAETMIMNLYRNIDKSLIQFDFVTHTNQKGIFDEEIRLLGGKIYNCPKYIGKNHFKYKKWWNIFFKEHQNQYSIIHGHIGSTASIYLSIAKKYGLYTIAHSHNTDGKLTFKGYLYKLMTFNTRNIADYFFACSQLAGEDRYGKKIVNNKLKYSVLKNAIDTDKFVFNEHYRTEIRNEFNIDRDKILIGHVGRFNIQKNHEFLVKIASEVIKKNKNVVFMLVGDGNLKEKIKKKCVALKIVNNVIFTGIRTDVNKFYQAFDLFLFPSFFEGLPVTLVEAQASGLVCLVSDSITKEVSITNLINYKSLNDSEVLWSNEILRLIQTKRKDTKQQIINSGYDIKTTSEWLTKFYMKLNRENNGYNNSFYTSI